MTRAPPLPIQRIAQQLEKAGYIVLDAPLLRGLSQRLQARCQDVDSSSFHPAGIGRGPANRQIASLRGDRIRWFDTADHTDRAYLGWMEELRRGLNAALFLGLLDYECHYAIYGAGAGYAKHSDVLHGT